MYKGCFVACACTFVSAVPGSFGLKHKGVVAAPSPMFFMRSCEFGRKWDVSVGASEPSPYIISTFVYIYIYTYV